MATAPVKSQPLHNFSLPFLKWGHKNHMNTNHRYRRQPCESTRESTPPPPAADHHNHRSSPSEHDSDGGSRNESETDKRRSRTVRNSFSFSSCSTQKHQAIEASGLERESDGGDVEREKVCDEVDVEESTAKPWNLRPRKAGVKFASEIGRVSKNGELPETSPVVQLTDNMPKSMRLRGFVEGHTSEKKEKRKFWISLSRDEIEEDVYSMTGSRPPRRPKKRPKNVQKQLDNVFPGLYLAGVSADAYRVYDAMR
ncbi:uncharacterized protein LOC132304099 [Cornus florida]|uniref:uncharacterized protein LOC132304099 n=1 Tax=Cornus florida TaxID=4283 RepID=UPI00289FC0B2|nr:uncharacterized protein LOC132304099 [Cornus florida]